MNCKGEIPETILEIAGDMDKATGLVATSEISHATPAAFGSHSPVRYCVAEIARQYIEETKVDVVLGGGVYNSSDEYNCQQFTKAYNQLLSNEAMAELAEKNGYYVVDTTKEMMTAAHSGNRKILGMFTGYYEGKTPEMFRLNEYGLTDANCKRYDDYPEDEPTLAQMTETALDTLELEQDGFFLMVRIPDRLDRPRQIPRLPDGRDARLRQSR